MSKVNNTGQSKQPNQSNHPKQAKSQKNVRHGGFSLMLSPTSIYEMAETRLEELKRIEKQKEALLKKTPEGKIHVIKTKGSLQFYLRTNPKDKSGAYIHKKEEPTIRRFLQKSYDEKIYKLIKCEIKSIESFLKHSKYYNLKIQRVYSDSPSEIKSYLNPIDLSNEDYVAYWRSLPFASNPMPITVTEYETDNGEIVRSKSELNIANALFKAGIPYKYECRLLLSNGKAFYPDFTLLDVASRGELYWEHRGMMDDIEYVKNAVKKTKEYNRSGIITGHNLIITEETATNPLGTDEINEIIKWLKNRG